MRVRPALGESRARGDAFSLIRDGILLFSFLFICRRLYQGVAFGGTAYKQADWLINSLNVDVRRGPFGTVLIHVSDAIGVSPLTVLAVFNVALLVVLFMSFRGLIQRVEDSRVALMLAVSPALFTLFWVASSLGALRKELMAFAALSLMAGAALQGNRVAFMVGALVLGVGFWAHEALVLFVPFFLWLAWFVLPPGKTRILATAVVCLSAVPALIYALRHRHIPDPGVVCQPLLDRGLHARICEGAINWLGRDAGDVSVAFAQWLTLPLFTGFAISYVFAMAPLIYILSRTQRVRASICWAFLAAVPFLPLYVVAVDWGRWMSFHIFAVSVGIAVALVSGKLVLVRPVRTDLCLCLLASAVLISPAHAIGAIYGGFFLEAMAFLSGFVVRISAIAGL